MEWNREPNEVARFSESIEIQNGWTAMAFSVEYQNSAKPGKRRVHIASTCTYDEADDSETMISPTILRCRNLGQSERLPKCSYFCAHVYVYFLSVNVLITEGLSQSLAEVLDEAFVLRDVHSIRPSPPLFRGLQNVLVRTFFPPLPLESTLESCRNTARI